MSNVQHSQAFLRKRKTMMILPLLIIPFLTLVFYAMGGGKGSDQGKDLEVSQGLNLKLPDAHLKEEKLMDKLSFYDKADKDSLKMEELMRSDPYYSKAMQQEQPAGVELAQLTETTAARHKQSLKTSPYDKTHADPEQEVMQKLALLEKEINKTTLPKAEDRVMDYQPPPADGFSGEVDRLENMMQLMDKGTGEDPEMKQLENTLDKILDIQHPQRVNERIKEKSMQQKEVVFAVSKQAMEDTVVNGFYGLNNDATTNDPNAIEAVVHDNQTLANGAVIKLRLISDIYINGELIPRDHFVFGTASLNGERLNISIQSIRNGSSLFPVKLEVCDLDGLPGIYIPGAITRDVAKQSADNSLQLMELSTMDPSLKAQAAAAGISTVKSLLSKKVKLVKVMVKAGYQVLLRDKNVKQ